MKYRDRALLKLFGLMMLAVMMFGCATAGSIVNKCRPATADEQQAVTDLFSRPDLATGEKIATAEAGKIAICVVTEIARDVVDKVSALAFSAPRSFAGGMFEEPPIVVVSRAWLDKHPQ